MENAVKSRLESVQLGEPQAYKNIAIVPFVAPADGTFQHRTLGETLAAGDLVVTEIYAQGSVPELRVINRGNKPVLLIDGEKLASAKQDRVLNASILLKEASEPKIPVSCRGRGRWSYTSKALNESCNVVNCRTRPTKTKSSTLPCFVWTESNNPSAWPYTGLAAAMSMNEVSSFAKTQIVNKLQPPGNQSKRMSASVAPEGNPPALRFSGYA